MREPHKFLNATFLYKVGILNCGRTFEPGILSVLSLECVAENLGLPKTHVKTEHETYFATVNEQFLDKYCQDSCQDNFRLIYILLDLGFLACSSTWGGGRGKGGGGREGGGGQSLPRSILPLKPLQLRSNLINS